jgi:predicted CXXCH cytochrome family protein
MNRRRLSPAWLALAVLLVARGAPAAVRPFRLLTPFAGAVVHAPHILLVFTVAPTTKLLVQVDGKATEVKDVLTPGNDEDLHHIRLPLDEGRRKIRILDASDEAELGALALTFIPPSSMRTAMGKNDLRYAFHTKEREGTCKGCHSMPETFETVAGRPLAPAGKVCGPCHPSVERSPSLHGPVAVYECFQCHDGDYKPSRFSQKTSQGASCSTCHKEFLSGILGGRKFVHGPVAAGVCIVCHDPHGAKSHTLLQEEAPGLCLRCHADTVPLPLDKSLHGKVPCTKCHDPHGGQTELLLASSGNAFCLACHAKIAEGDGHPIAGHPVEAAVDPSKPGKAMGCQSCHAPHGLKDISKADIQHNEAAERQFCRRCHY